MNLQMKDSWMNHHQNSTKKVTCHSWGSTCKSWRIFLELQLGDLSYNMARRTSSHSDSKGIATQKENTPHYWSLVTWLAQFLTIAYHLANPNQTQKNVASSKALHLLLFHVGGSLSWMELIVLSTCGIPLFQTNSLNWNESKQKPVVHILQFKHLYAIPIILLIASAHPVLSIQNNSNFHCYLHFSGKF